MQDLHTNFGVRCGRVHGIGHSPVAVGLLIIIQFGGRERGVTLLVLNNNTALFVGSDTAGNNHTDAACSTFSVESCHTVEAVGHLFQAGMHRTHNAAVSELGKTQV